MHSVRALARRYLGFEPLDPSREVQLSDLPLLTDTQDRDTGLRADSHIVREERIEGYALAEPREVGGPD